MYKFKFVIRIKGRCVIFNEDSARRVVFESACRMDVSEFGKYSRYRDNVLKRRQAFVSRLFQSMRTKFYGGFTKKFLVHVLHDLVGKGGLDCVRDKLDNIIREDDDVKWTRWRNKLVNLDAAIAEAREFAEHLDEMSLTNQQRGKILGVFAAGLQSNASKNTPSPWSHRVSPSKAVHPKGQPPFSPMSKMLLYSVGWDQERQIPPVAIDEVCRGWRAPGTDVESDNPFGWGPIADSLLGTIELKARPALQEACLLAASNMKPSKWKDVVRPGFKAAARALGFETDPTMDSKEVWRSILRQMSWVPLSEWTTAKTKKYKTGNSVIMCEVDPSLEHYVRTRARVAPMFVHDEDGCAIGLNPDKQKSKLFVSIILDAARLSRWAHGAGDEKDIFYETVIAIKVGAWCIITNP